MDIKIEILRNLSFNIIYQNFPLVRHNEGPILVYTDCTGKGKGKHREAKGKYGDGKRKT